MEQKPWMAYVQLDNTGTESTTELRERVGFRHYNLTGNDDILALDYVTGNFQEVHYLLGSYDFRVPGSEVARLKAFGGWSSYEGTELGIFDTEFSGQSWQIGGEFRTTLMQRKRLFLDLLAGARYQHVEADNMLAGTSGESGFVLPWVGLKLDGRGRYSHGSAGVTAELGVASEEKTALALLGRSDVEDVWGVIRFDLSMSTYLDPVFDPHFSGPAVHELYGAVRGQFAPGQQRLTPSFMYPVGGFYSVRGYPESVASGDTTVVASLEYRLHVLDLLRANNQADRGNWDLILRGFLDGGQAVYNDPLSFETDTTLISAGVGFDLMIMRNFQCRLDLGIPLQAVENGAEVIEEGEALLHFSVSASF
jgi:hemolysin activation/secretion protein